MIAKSFGIGEREGSGLDDLKLREHAGHFVVATTKRAKEQQLVVGIR
jgi:hypothetical protein